ncbi:hypothetical protein CALCODRAFT_144102 [Calocera cornea HHB12733]|uniref:Uncharacterized protein n=1 Tax=Calocera cornea HHB12733 TaxID=1353952 RepID=A0A165CSJ0_9BASI|nr:hypothetical protein CALCODRAFT_144102 [Calocera cornea HHB12733]
MQPQKLLCVAALLPCIMAATIVVIQPSLQSVFQSSGLLAGGVYWEGSAPLCIGNSCNGNDLSVVKADAGKNIVTQSADFGRDCIWGTQKSLCTAEYKSCMTQDVTFSLTCNTFSRAPKSATGVSIKFQVQDFDITFYSEYASNETLAYSVSDMLCFAAVTCGLTLPQPARRDLA